MIALRAVGKEMLYLSEMMKKPNLTTRGQLEGLVGEHHLLHMARTSSGFPATSTFQLARQSSYICHFFREHLTDRTRITSYINNLHPQKHKDLYGIIESVITKSIPLWNKTLTPLKEGCGESWRIKYELAFDPDPENMADEDKPQQEENETEDDYWERIWQWEADTRKAVLPEPEEFQPPDAPKHSVDLIKDYAHRGLQIIVKYGNPQFYSHRVNLAN